ncbi:MAG: WG repeat-containing protein [Firmicutes bacterium]|nr:WG repeat-containing protein [Bacillota bacterium]
MNRNLLLLAPLVCFLFIAVTVTGCAIENVEQSTTSLSAFEERLEELEPYSQPIENVELSTIPLSPFEERLAALAPYTPPLEPVHYYGGSVGEFIPSDEYGKVYPYIGKIQEAKPNGEGYWFPESCLYGFVDEKGQIICDPVYNSVTLLTYGDKAAYVIRKTSLKQGVPTNYFNWDYQEWCNRINSEWYEYYSVVSIDGSFFGQYDEVYCWEGWYRSGHGEDKIAEYEFIAVCQDDLWGVIDYDGTEILPCQYYNAPLFSEGLAAVYDTNPDDYQYEYSYIDCEGNRAIGTYNGNYMTWLMYRLAFSHGRAMRVFNDFYGFIDKSGSLVVAPAYPDVRHTKGYNENGLALVVVEDHEDTNYGWIDFKEETSRYGIIDINGEYVVPLRKIEHIRYSCQEGDYYLLGGDYESELLSKDGKMIKKIDIDKYRKCLEGDIFTTNTGVENIKTGEVYYHGNTPFVRRSWGPWGAPYGGSEVIQLDGRPCVIGYIWNYPKPPEDDFYYGMSYITKFGVLDVNGPVLDFEYDYLQWMGEYFCAVQGDYGGILKPDGTWFFKVELKKEIID